MDVTWQEWKWACIWAGKQEVEWAPSWIWEELWILEGLQQQQTTSQ